jgi:hypothetical protein
LRTVCDLDAQIAELDMLVRRLAEGTRRCATLIAHANGFRFPDQVMAEDWAG